MNEKMKNWIKKGWKQVKILSVTSAISIMVYAGVTTKKDANGLWFFESGNTISSTQINYNFANAVPAGAVMAFYRSSCPAGWEAADGSTSVQIAGETKTTPDLRGVFIRGLNGNRNDGNGDPELNSRALGSFQGDDNKLHNHMMFAATNVGDQLFDSVTNRYSNYQNEGGARYREYRLAFSSTYPSQGMTSDKGSEARPKNVALLYCIKNTVNP